MPGVPGKFIIFVPVNRLLTVKKYHKSIYYIWYYIYIFNRALIFVCQAIVDEFDDAIASVDPKKKIEAAAGRMDSSGNTNAKVVSLSLRACKGCENAFSDVVIIYRDNEKFESPAV